MSLFKKFLSFFFICFFILFLTVLSVKVKAGEETYKTALFGSSYNSKSVSAYTDTWSSTNDGFTVNLSNFNNNNNGWNYVKCGRKNTASIGTISTPSAIDKKISKVNVSVDAFTNGKVNSFKLYYDDNSGFSSPEEISLTIATGVNTFTIPESKQLENGFYKIEFNCASGSSNGLVTVSKVDFITFVQSSEASTSVSIGEDFNMMVDGSKQLETNFDGVAEEVVWESSKPEVATIDDEGNITAVGMGTTTISVLSENDLEDSCVVTVYPDNTNEITIATANAIAELTGNINSPYTYKAKGKVKLNSVNDNEFVLEDNTGEIYVFKYSHGFSENEKVLIEGNVINYSNSKKEFTNNSVLTHLYTVTLDSNDGNATIEKEVVAGEKISKPVSDPVKDGYIFEGWFDESTDLEWDFNNTVNSDLNLYAKFTENNLQNLINVFASSTSVLARLSVNYTKTVNDEISLYSENISEGKYVIYYNGKIMKASVSSNRLQYDEVTPSNDKIDSVELNTIWTISKSGDYWTLYNEATRKYAASNGTKNQAALAENVDDKALWTITGSSTYEFVNKQNADSGVNANLRNNGTYGFACYASGTGGALSLYKVGEDSYELEKTQSGNADVALQFGVRVNSELYNSLLDESAEFGILYAKSGTSFANYDGNNENIRKIVSSPVTDNGDYQFGVSINEIPLDKLDYEISAAAYVKVGTDYYLTSVRTESVKSVAALHANDANTPARHLGMLQWLAK